MEKEKISNKNNLIIIFLVILQFLLIYLALKIDNLPVLFWFCNHTPLLLALSFYFKKPQLIKSLLNVGFLFQFFWTIDFFSKILFNKYIFGTTEYLFAEPYGWMVIIPILSHIVMMNLVLITTIKIKPQFTNLFYSTIYILFLFAFTVNFTPVDVNINCVHKVCNLGYTFQGYTYFWPLFTFFLIILPTHIIQNLLYKLNELIENGKE